MTKRKSSAGFTISWPFIVACIIGYNLFFGDDEDKKDVDVEPLNEKPAVVEKVNKKPNSIDEIVKKIKKEIDTSVVIQESKDTLTDAISEVQKIVKKDKSEPPPYEEPKDAPPQNLESVDIKKSTDIKEKPESTLEPLKNEKDNEPEFTDL